MLERGTWIISKEWWKPSVGLFRKSPPWADEDVAGRVEKEKESGFQTTVPLFFLHLILPLVHTLYFYPSIFFSLHFCLLFKHFGFEREFLFTEAFLGRCSRTHMCLTSSFVFRGISYTWSHCSVLTNRDVSLVCEVFLVALGDFCVSRFSSALFLSTNKYFVHYTIELMKYLLLCDFFYSFIELISKLHKILDLC